VNRGREVKRTGPFSGWSELNENGQRLREGGARENPPSLPAQHSTFANFWDFAASGGRNPVLCAFGYKSGMKNGRKPCFCRVVTLKHNRVTAETGEGYRRVTLSGCPSTIIISF